MKLNPTVRRETIYISIFTVALSAVMELVFVIIGRWDVTVLTGNLLGAAAAILNFFLMGLTVQMAVNDTPENAKKRVRVSQYLRFLMMLCIAAVGVAAPCFHWAASVIPLFFPRIAIAMRPLFNGIMDPDGKQADASAARAGESAVVQDANLEPEMQEEAAEVTASGQEGDTLPAVEPARDEEPAPVDGAEEAAPEGPATEDEA